MQGKRQINIQKVIGIVQGIAAKGVQQVTQTWGALFHRRLLLAGFLVTDLYTVWTW